jgi:hypothetical protein
MSETPKKWTPEEEERLLMAHDSGMGLEDIATQHERSPTAILARLHKLGKVLPGEEMVNT